MPVAGIGYFIKMCLRYMKSAEMGMFFPNNFFKQFGIWSIVWIILWIVIIFIDKKCKIKKANERKISKKILQCIVMLVMVVISFWIYVSVLTGKFNHYMMLVFLVEIIYVFLTIFLYLPKCPQSLILSALRAFCFCGKPRISRSIFLYFPCQSWLKSW